MINYILLVITIACTIFNLWLTLKYRQGYDKGLEDGIRMTNEVLEEDQIVIIKPCAKCGGAPVLYDTKCGDKTVPAIKCQRCGRMFRQTFWDRERLIKAWNTYDRKEEGDEWASR